MSRREGRNYMPVVVLNFLWWALLGLLVVFVDPVVVADFPVVNSYGAFFLLLFLALWFSLSLILDNRRRGLLVALVVVVLGYMRVWDIFSVVSAVFLILTVVMFELYFSGKI
jgi:hypothetical protein